MASSPVTIAIRGTKIVSQANSYCMAEVNGRPCRERVALPVPYTMKDVSEAMCVDCRRANVEALASTVVSDQAGEVELATGVSSCVVPARELHSEIS